MEVKIGVQNVNRELVLDIDQSGEDIESAVAKAISDGLPLVTLTDVKGRKVIVPSDKIAYLELGSPTIGQLGFRS